MKDDRTKAQLSAQAGWEHRGFSVFLKCILKMAVQNRFVRGHLLVKMYDLSRRGRPKSLLIPDAVFAYSSMETSC
jgi:hypothetical protein